MKKYSIGIDMGGTNTKIALVGSGGRILEKRQFLTKSCKNKDILIKTIADNINCFKARGIAGVGIGVPGLFDSKNGIVHYLTNIAGWKDVNLKKELKARTGIGKIFVDNDVNLMALAEARYGAGRRVKSLFCVTLGTGVGGGIVINGEVYRGNTQSAGEVGHIVLDASGPKCNCGGRGCVEAYVGNNHIIKKFGVTPQELTKLAKQGNMRAKNIWKETAEYLGRGLVMVVNVFDPEVIIIGGGVSGAGEFILKPLREYIRKHALSVPAEKVRIVRAKLGNDAGVIGAAELVR